MAPRVCVPDEPIRNGGDPSPAPNVLRPTEGGAASDATRPKRAPGSVLRESGGRGVQEELERMLEPFTTRPADDVPTDGGPVRILAFFMPEAAHDGRAND
jgi:hypothetical protein